MHRTAAYLRHRELTQETFDIGDEVAGYIENVAEAVADVDAELIADCLAELEEVVADARTDSRRIVAELSGLRPALTTGRQSGELSAAPALQVASRPPTPLDAPALARRYPLGFPTTVSALSRALERRTDATLAFLKELCGWVLAVTAAGARDLDAVSLPAAYGRAGGAAAEAALAWCAAVPEVSPAFARSRRGRRPPEFLAERAWALDIAGRVAARRTDTLTG